uniref:Hox cluster protein ShxD n=1 Tax=Pararge aegeria TaxID=116150 RepID=A0A060D708_9NEOP|nr:Hox cluster protein ShxD [Pararge aegeria]
MLHCNRFQVQLENPDASFVQYGNTEEFIAGHNCLQHYTDEPVLFENTNCVINQNEEIENWIKGCQVLGFIPDHPSPENYLSTERCNYTLEYKCQRTYTRSSHAFYSRTQSKLRVNLKRKRKRTIFTTEQIVFLEGVFQRKPYITKDERLALMNRMQLSEKAIKIWFQNRRRMSDKKCQEYASDSPSSVDTHDSFSERLTSIEAQIQENTDENGYVTLNDHVMSALVGVIDDYLSKDCDSDSSTITEDFLMYEPISPASTDQYII